MTVHEIGHGHTLEAKAWLHPANGLDIDTLAERMAAIPGNVVREVHRDCDCRHGDSGGAKVTGVPDDHLLMIHAIREVSP